MKPDRQFTLNRYFFLWLCFLLLITVSCRNIPDSSISESAKNALSTYQVADGFKIELVASEPLISDPVDMEIDEYGRMYVVEMHGYPLDRSGTGKIILLADSNGDGVMDKRTVFAEGLELPNSIMRWKKGVLVTDAPNVLYLEDTNGDGKADVKDTLLTGFALTNPQHNVNNPVYGLDNWIYLAHQGSVSTQKYKEEFGDEGSEIVFPSSPGSPRLPKNANGLSVRFRPDQKQIEMMASNCQFGHTFDEWGHWFGCNNSNQGYQEVIANRYFERNPALPISDAVQDMSDHLNAPEVFPTTIHPDRQLLSGVGVMTSGSGLTAYLGGEFTAPYNENATFIAEPVYNLVHVDLLKESGTSFTSSRILEQKEFLSSTDAWARPVNFYVGPDGALYVLDYYRKVIESPEWMADDAVAAGGLYAGSDMGRIFRITPTNAKKAGWTKGLKLGDASDKELIENLANKNNWWRVNAQRLLVDRNDKKSIPGLIAMAKNTFSDVGRLHALWTLEGMNALDSPVLIEALKDPVAGIRENAIRLAELHLASAPQLVDALFSLQTDPDPKVRFQLLLTLGFVNTPQSVQTRTKLLFADINDKWVQIAALSAGAETSSLLNVVLERFRSEIPAYSSMVQRLTSTIGINGDAESIYPLIQKTTTTTDNINLKSRIAILEGLSTGLKNRKSPLMIPPNLQKRLVRTFFENNSSQIRNASYHVLKVRGISEETLKDQSIERALLIIKDTSQKADRRADAIDFLSLGDPSSYVPLLEKLLVPQEPSVVQLAAVRTLNLVPGTDVRQYIIGQWPELTPEIRDAAIETFLGKPERVTLLLTAMEQGLISPTSVSFWGSVGLMMQTDPTLRIRARAIFTRSQEEGKKVNEKYQKALELTGDPLHGRAVYAASCVICHQVRGEFGIAIGPDLGTVHNWTKEDIMANILDPNLSIAAGFDLWNVELNTGESIQGIIKSETPTAITLVNSGKTDRTINRQEIKSLTTVNVSAMPSGLEKNIDQQQMADLLSFLRQN
ncbi:HEAT repeat domain-containing protein [Flavobacteriaceae bacterium F89]|uniref:HEAT repeat domain-containing protein n=1 Tax=Cerina litoralis TaxID=2874477 RepID=A0AAE3ER78_9FLAO|nr:PVC-type heme-binding CxxCH protein [Cerina litoralis]MCG2459488.1 HEAT repeat domain-containing protein [Cerina litoralis]